MRRTSYSRPTIIPAPSVPALPLVGVENRPYRVGSTVYIWINGIGYVSIGGGGSIPLYTSTGTNTDGPMDQNSVSNELALRAPIASPTFTGNPAGPTPTYGDNDTSLATTAFVQAAISGTTKISMYTVKLSGSGLATGSTQFVDMYGSSSLSATESTRACVAGVAGVVSAIYVYMNTTQPGTGSLVIDIRINGVTSSATLTIAAGSAAGVFSATGLSQAIVANEVLNYRIKNNATSTSGALFSIVAVILT